ncbi:MAG: FtsX-like permease family protein [Acidobacteria bacterium]|nr:FtsX-like permease family protein [Acidobacteriota bacterium]
MRANSISEAPLATRLMATLLRRVWATYPPGVVRRYAAEAESVFLRQSADARAAGSGPLFRFWIRSFRDATGAAFRLRRGSFLPGSIPARRDGGATSLSTIRDDVRAAFRSLLAAPMFTAAAITILALGVGGSTGVFTLLHSVALRPLPYEAPEELAVLWTWETQRELPDGTSYLNWGDWQERNSSFDDLAMYVRPEFTSLTLSGNQDPRRIETSPVTQNFFDVLGVQPRLGRNFNVEEELAAAAVVVVSDGFWRQELAADPDALGSTIMLDDRAHEVIGVMPSGFRYPFADTAVWLPHSLDTGWPEREFSRGMDYFVVLGRLRDGVSFDVAQRDMNAVARQLETEYPDTNTNMGVRVVPLLRHVTGDSLPQALWLLFGGTFFVLLIAAANVAHLALARSATRSRELAIRAAIGAGGWRLARQQAAEIGLVAAAAGVLGAGLSLGVLRALIAVAPADLPRLDQVGIDPMVLAAAWLGTVTLGLGFSLLPAWSAARADAAAALREGSRGATHGGHRTRGALVIAEVALAMVLVSGAALLLQSLARAADEAPGVAMDGAVIGRINVPRDRYERPELSTFYSELFQRLSSEPGIESAGAIGSLLAFRIPDMSLSVEGLAPEDTPRPPTTGENVFPGFFATAGATLLEGRALTLSDLPGESPARQFVINETAARTFWPGESAVGKRFVWGDVLTPDREWNEVIGVVADLRRNGLDVAPVADFYAAGLFHEGEIIVVGAPGAEEATAGAFRRIMGELDARIPISDLRTTVDLFGESLAGRRFQSLLSGSFAGLALLLSAAGLFGLLYESVARQRREIGARLALGARPSDLLQSVLFRALGLTAAGIVLGLAGAVALADVLSGFLYGVGSTDPVTLVSAAALMMVVGILASLTPGIRATHVHPVETLNSD